MDLYNSFDCYSNHEIMVLALGIWGLKPCLLTMIIIVIVIEFLSHIFGFSLVSFVFPFNQLGTHVFSNSSVTLSFLTTSLEGLYLYMYPIHLTGADLNLVFMPMPF